MTMYGTLQSAGRTSQKDFHENGKLYMLVTSWALTDIFCHYTLVGLQWALRCKTKYQKTGQC